MSQSLAERARELLAQKRSMLMEWWQSDCQKFLEDVLPVLEGATVQKIQQLNESEFAIDRISGGDSECPHCMDAEGTKERRTLAIAQMVATIWAGAEHVDRPEAMDMAEEILAEAEKRAK